MAEDTEIVDDTKIVNDLPTGYDDTVPDRLDENFRTYFLQEKGNAIVNVEKWSVNKKDYIPSTLGISRGRPHLNQYLIKEDSFTDIGGGRMTFLKHYAQIPEPWFDYEQKTTKYFQGNVVSGINYDSKYGKYGFPHRAYAVRNVPFLAKATRYYVTKTTMDFYLFGRYTLGEPFFGEPSSERNWLYPNALSDNTYLTNLSTGYEYPEKLFVNAPRVSLSSSSTTPVAIAPDKITLWKPNIYEITRYEANINHRIPPESDGGIPITFRWIFDEGAFETNVLSNGTMRVDFILDGGEDTSDLTYGIQANYPVLMERLVNDTQKSSFQNCRVIVTTENNLAVVGNFLSGGVFENPLRTLSSQEFNLKWDGSSSAISLTFIIG